MSIKIKFSLPLKILALALALALVGWFVFSYSNSVGQSIINDRQAYPLLKDNPTSDNYKLQFVANQYRGNITYSPSDDFFIVETKTIFKINSKGANVFSKKLKEESRILPFTHYLVNAQGVIDFSHEKPKLEQFVQIVNGDKNRTLTVDSFNEIYTQAYKDADVVVYDVPNFAEEIDKYRAYMRIDGDWVLFYLSLRALDLDEDYDLGVTVKNYPAKYSRMILLKDTAADVYSASSYRLRDREIALNEDKLNYPPLGVLELIDFEQTEVHATLQYTSIPYVYRGQAYHRLTYDGEMLLFSETALRQTSKEVELRMNWFVLPEPYQQKTPIGFLQFKPSDNMSTSGSDGVYVLIRK